MQLSWYALHVKSRFENLVRTQLETKGYETFLPTRTTIHHCSDRVKPMSLPLFPGYVFCRFDVERRLPILITPGVNLIVGTGRMPVPVDESELLPIRHVLDSGVIPQPWPYLRAGDRAQVIAGPLKGLSGMIVRAQGRDRLVVSLHLLMRSLAVEIGGNYLEPLHRAADMRIHVG